MSDAPREDRASLTPLGLANTPRHCERMFVHAPMGFLVLRSDRAILEANPWSAKLLEVAPIELPGMRFGRFLSEPSILEFNAAFSRVLAANREEELLVRLGSAEGEGKHVLARLAKIDAEADSDADEATVLLCLVDKSKEQEAERIRQETNERLAKLVEERSRELAEVRAVLSKERERLARAMRTVSESEWLYRAIFENTAVGVGLFDQDRTIVKANQRFHDIFGWEKDGLHGQNARVIHLNEEAYLGFGAKYYDSLVGGGIVSLIYHMRRKDESSIWCDIFGKAVNPTNIADGVIWVVYDVTERIRAEELREEVERITRHDLRAPLNSLLSVPELLLEDENLTEEQREHLRLMRETAQTMLVRINTSLKLYKMESGGYDMEPDCVDLVRITKSVVDEFAGLSREYGVAVEVAVQGEEQVLAMGERILCTDIMRNLLANALEASPRGATVRAELFSREAEVWAVVHNVGAVPLEIRETFHEKYVTHGKASGTGLGTYSAKLMARTMGGSISFESSEEAGTTVRVRLPKYAPRT